MKCKIVVNRDSGNFEKLDLDKLTKLLDCNAEREIIDSKSQWNAQGFDTVVVCGGDGTLFNALEKCRGKRLVYVPCGTLNETAATASGLDRLNAVNGMPFAYVCATGSFTEIGYSAESSAKKQLKFFAYLQQIAKAYRCHEINAKIDIDGKSFEGDFTLLMVLKSHRCFGFRFNKDYKSIQKPFLLAVRSVGKDSIRNRIKMFFPFFRIFFCGAKQQVKKQWLLLPFDRLTIEIDKPQSFCIDGEKRTLGGTLRFSQFAPEIPIEIVPPPKQSRRKTSKSCQTEK